MRTFATLLILMWSAPALAAMDFSCTVKEVYRLSDEGFLVPGKGFSTPDVGSEFIVNRQSGQITGHKITNTMSGVMPSVYSHLPTENSYSAITVYEPNYTIDFLQVHEYVGAPEKPFLYKGAFGEVVTGICVQR